MILHNGKIITVDRNFSITQGVAIRDGKFVAVGSDEDVKAHVEAGSQMIDLHGRTVMPGIIDSHTHPVGVGLNLLSDVQMWDVQSLEDIFDRLNEATLSKQPGEWITTASNWYLGQVDRRPTLSELNAVVPNHPLWLPLGMYEGFTNSLGIKFSGITNETISPQGGVIYKDAESGEPTGHLRGTALNLIINLLPAIEPTIALKEAIPYFHSIGITTIGDEGLDYFFPRAFEAYQWLRHNAELNLRCVLMHGIRENMRKDEIVGMIRASACCGLRGAGLGDDFLKVIGFKTVNENTLTGENLWPTDYLKNVLLEAARNKVTVRIHSVCAANDDILELFKEVNTIYPIQDLRWGIVHMHFQSLESIEACKTLGLVINHELGFSFLGVGPDVWYGRLFGAPKYPERLIAPVPIYLKEEIPFSLNSDAGGATNQTSLWSSVYAACNRQMWPSWGDEYGITREDALRAVTMGGAYRLGMEERIGSIELGKLADLTVLSADPLTCNDEELRNLKAEMTILAGRIVHPI